MNKTYLLVTNFYLRFHRFNGMNGNILYCDFINEGATTNSFTATSNPLFYKGKYL